MFLLIITTAFLHFVEKIHFSVDGSIGGKVKLIKVDQNRSQEDYKYLQHILWG